MKFCVVVSSTGVTKILIGRVTNCIEGNGIKIANGVIYNIIFAIAKYLHKKAINFI